MKGGVVEGGDCRVVVVFYDLSNPFEYMTVVPISSIDVFQDNLIVDS